jgi:Domain of unknown function (DUF4806)
MIGIETNFKHLFQLVFADTILTEYNWTGQVGKQALNTLKIIWTIMYRKKISIFSTMESAQILFRSILPRTLRIQRGLEERIFQKYDRSTGYGGVPDSSTCQSGAQS